RRRQQLGWQWQQCFYLWHGLLNGAQRGCRREPLTLWSPNMEPKPAPSDRPEPAPKKRFRVVKLEERIAPGGGNGNGSNATCGNIATCHQCHGSGTVSSASSSFY